MMESMSDSDQNLRWCKWQEQSREADRRTEKRMKILMLVVAALLLAWTLWVVFRQVSVPQADRFPGKVADAQGEQYGPVH